MAVSDDHEELAPRLKRLSSCGPEVSQTDDSEFDINSRRSKQRSRQRKMGKLLEEAQVIDFLLERGFADANARCKQTGLCPLHIAAKTLGKVFLEDMPRTGDAQMLRLLLRVGAKTDMKTAGGFTGLQIAERANSCGSHVDVIALLKTDVKVMSARLLLEQEAL